MGELRLVDKDVLRAGLRARPGYEYHQADELIDQAQYLFPLRIADEAVFRNLIPGTWVFEEGEHPRTLERLVRRLRDDRRTWGQLAADPPRVQAGEWYDRVQRLCDTFDWRRLGPLFVTPVKGRRRQGCSEGDELGPSPTASLAIVSGVHCSLAAMTLVDEGVLAFQQVESILVLPRVDY